MEKQHKIDQLVTFKYSGFTYLFNNPPTLNFLPMPEEQGYVAVSYGYDPFFVGKGKTRHGAEYDWKTKFHYYYSRMMKYDDVKEELKKLFDSAIDSEMYLNSAPIVIEKEGVVVKTRLPEGLPSVIRWRGSSDIVAVPDFSKVHEGMLYFKKGEHFRAVVSYDRGTYKLTDILYVAPRPDEET